MTEIQEIEAIETISKAFSDIKIENNDKLEQDIVAMELQLKLFKQNENRENLNFKKKIQDKGYFWKSSRKFDGKNYANKLIEKIEKKKKFKKKYKKMKKTENNIIKTKNIDIKTNNHTIGIQFEGNNECCYHCYKIFKPNINSIQIKNDYFCDKNCFNQYQWSIMKTCSNDDCIEKFFKENGFKNQGAWFCVDCFTKLEK